MASDYNEESAISAFCAREYPVLVGLIGLYLGDRAVAEEIAQDSLAKAWVRWRKVSTLDSPAAWVRRVALNGAKNHLRRLRSERNVKARLKATVIPLTAEPGESAPELQRALATLPHRQRAALILRYFLDLTFTDVAEHMDVPEATARSLVHRGLQRLRNEDVLTTSEGVVLDAR